MSNGKKIKKDQKQTHIITLEKHDKSSVAAYVRCTCGWVFGKDQPEDKILTLGVMAKKHSVATGHPLRRHE